jgi:hypothetical protein
VLFGGANATLISGETWTWDGTNWSNLSPATGPVPRDGAALAPDGTGALMLFGGEDANGMSLGDGWRWDGAAWTPLCGSGALPACGPPARAFHMMAFDANRGLTVLFGGEDAGASMNDTWEWNGAMWTQACLTVACQGILPTARDRGGLVYDTFRQATVLFGGVQDIPMMGTTPATSHEQGDTWSWDGNNWTALNVKGPDARHGFGMAFDSARRLTTLFGGSGRTEQASRWLDLATLGAGFLTNIAPTNDPPGFSVLSSMSGGPTSEQMNFLFCDDNLNRPVAATAYSSMVDVGTVTVAIAQSPDTGDRLGMSFSQQYCPRHPFGANAGLTSSTIPGRMRVGGLGGQISSASSGGDLGSYLSIDGAVNAANNGSFLIAQVVDSSTVEVINPFAAGFPDSGKLWSVKPPRLVGCSSQCQSTPCYLESSVTGFGYGVNGTATITGGSMPADPSKVEVDASYNGVTTQLFYDGVCQ